MNRLSNIITVKIPFLDSYTASAIISGLMSFGPVLLQILGGLLAATMLFKGCLEAYGKILDNKLKTLDFNCRERMIQKELDDELKRLSKDTEI
jgi:hypothetical protein